VIHLGTRQTSAPEIGIAPLVDCVFLLLIFFLLTSSFSRKRAIDITLPASSTATEQKKEVIEVAVSDMGEIELNGKTVDLENLASALERAARERDKQPVLLLADKRVSLEMLTKLIDCIRAAKLESVSIATRRDLTDRPTAEEAKK